jgi:hypothetical protein
MWPAQAIKIRVQPDSAVKAALSVERFCPTFSMAPVFGDCEDGGGVVLKRTKARPRWGECVLSPTGPSQVEFNIQRLA